MTSKELDKVLEEHAKWLCGEGGKRADLYGADLYEANLYGANLYGANLYGADLYGADLCGANLYGANLCGADLRGANLYEANLYGANLYGADLREANLCGANLRGADLRGANLREANLYGANLYGADLDFSCLPLWCGSLSMKTDQRQRIQIAYHFLSLIKHGEGVTGEELAIYEFCREYANRFHRDDVGRLEGLDVGNS
jgi:hypothetical protein